MRRKSKIGTVKICKYKARLNVHGGQQEHGVNYLKRYAPVVMWTTISFSSHYRSSKKDTPGKLGFLLGYMQDKVDAEIKIRLPDIHSPGLPRCRQKQL